MVDVMLKLTVVAAVLFLGGLVANVIDMIDTFCREPYQMSDEAKVKGVRSNILWIAFTAVIMTTFILSAVALGSKPDEIIVPIVTKVCPESTR